MTAQQIMRGQLPEGSWPVPALFVLFALGANYNKQQTTTMCFVLTTLTTVSI